MVKKQKNNGDKKNWFLEMVTAHTGLSSKRVCGFLGWFVSLIIAIYCTITSKEAPDIVETIVFSAILLLGVDSVTSIWKCKTPPNIPPSTTQNDNQTK